MTQEARSKIIEACLSLVSLGLTHGTSGNVSMRAGDAFLITPSAVPYAEMTPDSICALPLSGPPVEGQFPSTEWRFHQAIFQARPDVQGIVHAHPPNATAVATQRRAIPAVHYMVAAFGGEDVPCTDYALFGGRALADMVAGALKDRHGCLMANHGATTVGDSLSRALWRMQELEMLARVMLLAEQSGTPHILSDTEIAEVLTQFEGYGVRS